MKISPGLVVSLLAASVMSVNAAPSFLIEQIGLYGTGYTSLYGNATSGVDFLNTNGQVAGFSNRHKSTDSSGYGRDTWIYNGTTTVKTGFGGAGYTSLNGTVQSENVALNNAGQVAGYTSRYSGTTNSAIGRDAWLYNGSSTVQIGFSGAGYTMASGQATSTITALNESGNVAGISVRYGGVNSYGQDAWLYNGSSTQQIGLTGEGYTRIDSTASSTVSALNSAGQVAGLSSRYDADTYNAYGRNAWLFNGSTTVQIGMAEVLYTTGTGTALIAGLNDAGQVAGTSTTYNADQAAWIYNGSNTVQIGLTGNGYTASSGRFYSNVHSINTAGDVAGTSNRYKSTGASSYGEAAWIYHGGNSVRIGLFGVGYVNQFDVTSSSINFLNNNGQVAGSSSRYSAANNNGSDVWFYDGATTKQIGLTGAGYIKLDGTATSTVFGLNDAGQVAGSTNRYKATDNTNGHGADVWFYNGTDTVQIGLTGAGFTRLDGYSNSVINFLNSNGQVAGYSSNYKSTDNLTTHGQSAWLYDASLNQVFNLTMDSKSNGDSASLVTYLGDDGVTLGYYAAYNDVNDAVLGNRAFYFKVGEGLFDLGALVGDLTTDGWASLASAIRSNGIGNIVGQGKLLDAPNVTAAFILKPGTVPPVDTDNDGVPESSDNCPSVGNADQLNTDGDAQGNACDDNDDNDANTDLQEIACSSDPLSADSVCPVMVDIDVDGIDDSTDNCPSISNAEQLNTDGDLQGNVCDSDDDNDGQSDEQEMACGSNTVLAASMCTLQAECPAPDVDADADCLEGTLDNCPSTANVDQRDDDVDGIGNACDSSPYPVLLSESVAKTDGWILESTETSKAGGKLDAASQTLMVGDSAKKQEYRSVLSFDTSELPDTAVIVSVSLQMVSKSYKGSVSSLGALTADIRKPYLGTSASIALNDFAAKVDKASVVTLKKSGSAYKGSLNASGKSFINKKGATQFRVHFAKDDNNDKKEDSLSFYSGSAASGKRPVLNVEYYVP